MVAKIHTNIQRHIHIKLSSMPQEISMATHIPSPTRFNQQRRTTIQQKQNMGEQNKVVRRKCKK